MMLSENVFDDWCVEKIEAYGEEHGLEYTRDEYCTLILETPNPPVGFLRAESVVVAYWLGSDLQKDLGIYNERGTPMESTLSLQHDEMCEFLTAIIDDSLVDARERALSRAT